MGSVQSRPFRQLLLRQSEPNMGPARGTHIRRGGPVTTYIENLNSIKGEMPKFMGLRWVEIDDERAVSEMPFGPKIALKLGGVFGGALLAMADLTGNNL